MTANGIKVLEALAKMDRVHRVSRTPGWWYSFEIAKAAGISPRGIAATLNALYWREECLRREWQHQRRQCIYQINEKGLEIARAA